MGSHRAAVLTLAAIVALWAMAMTWTLSRARPDGAMMLAVFPPATPAPSIMAAVAGADARLVAETWWPGAVVLHADAANVEAELTGAGAWWVLPATPFRVAMIGGCGFGPVATHRLWSNPPEN